MRESTEFQLRTKSYTHRQKARNAPNELEAPVLQRVSSGDIPNVKNAVHTSETDNLVEITSSVHCSQCTNDDLPRREPLWEAI
jgi:hypothetical protein